MGVCLRSEGSPTSQRLRAVISARRSCSRFLLRSHRLRSTVVQSGGGSPEPPLFFVPAARHPFGLAPAAVTSPNLLSDGAALRRVHFFLFYNWQELQHEVPYEVAGSRGAHCVRGSGLSWRSQLS